MKIAMVSSDYFPDIGGVAAHVYNLSRTLVKLGQEVHIVNPRRYTASGKNVIQEDEGLIIHRLYINSFIRKLGYSYLKYSLLTADYIKRKIGDFDILHQHDYLTSSLACFWLSSKYPWVWTNHTSGFVQEAYAHRFKIRLIKKAYNKTKAIIAPSREIEILSQRTWPEKNIFYIPNGVDIGKFKPTDKEDVSRYKKEIGLEEADKIILCPRRWMVKNGVDYLIKAMALLKKEKLLEAKIKFIFVGSSQNSSYARGLTSIIEEENLKDNILLLGEIPYQKMPAYYSMADVVVVPSLVEAISLSALEAMASGKAVIATNVGGLAEIIQNNQTGISVEPKNYKMLAGAVIKLLNDSNRREALGLEARKFVEEKYSWDNIAKRTLNVYQMAANKN